MDKYKQFVEKYRHYRHSGKYERRKDDKDVCIYGVYSTRSGL